MTKQTTKSSKKLKYFWIMGGGLIVILLVVLLFLIMDGPKIELKIEGVESSLNNEEWNGLGDAIYNLLQSKFDKDVEKPILAVVRSDSYKETFEDEVRTAEFLVDVDSYQQTYRVVYSSSDTVEIINSTFISCPLLSEMKYPEAECISMYNTSKDLLNIKENPIINDLPIVVDEFNYDSRMAIHYEVRGYIDDAGNVTLNIVDYSGGNYDNALQKIAELGYDTKDYTINYIDKGGDF